MHKRRQLEDKLFAQLAIGKKSGSIANASLFEFDFGKIHGCDDLRHFECWETVMYFADPSHGNDRRRTSQQCYSIDFFSL